MPKVSQETYDEIVQENMDVFNLSRFEAIQEAIAQLEAQGADLTDIKKDGLKNEPCSLTIAIKTLRKLETNETLKNFVEEIIENLNILNEECEKDLANRVKSEKEGAYNVLINLLEKTDNEFPCSPLHHKILETLSLFMTNQPDPLDDRGIDFMLKFLKSNDTQLQEETLRWMKVCCIKHEANRSHIFEKGILEILKNQILASPNVNKYQLICATLATFTLDDDIRVEFGHAHDRAKSIATELLPIIIKSFTNYETEHALIAEIMALLSSILVRSDFCKQFEELGGIRFILNSLINYQDNPKCCRQGFKLLKCLAGNDQCKSIIVQKENGAPIIASTLNKYQSNPQISNIGLSCVAALSLRCPQNSEEFFKNEFPEIIIEIMKLHLKNAELQRNAAWTIRNMVSRNRNQTKSFLDLNAEELLNNALKSFDKKFSYDFKSALRDLGCKVDLKEEWTGKGGMLNHNES